ncbi:GMC oxidoreductase [Nocardia asiatica]|uniref:GMC oxidoreductase n=1 Tax=Nocardia asiatica TaxID=209252 RepID=UPI003EE1BD4E
MRRPSCGGRRIIARTVRCGTVVLAGGTIECSRLAIQALQPAGLLEKARLDGLSDKIVHGFIAPLDAATLPPEVVRLADEEAFLYARGDETLRSNLFVRLSRNTVGAVLVDVWAMGEQLAGEHGTVECEPGAGLRWETTVRAECSATDRESIARQRDELTAVWSAFAKESGLAGSALKFPEFDQPERTLENVLPRLGALSPGQPPVTWSGPLGSEYHESGTLAFGRMLNARHEVRGMRDLYVAGPAAYPRPGAANPSLTNLALAKRLSGVLAG